MNFFNLTIKIMLLDTNDYIIIKQAMKLLIKTAGVEIKIVSNVAILLQFAQSTTRLRHAKCFLKFWNLAA